MNRAERRRRTARKVAQRARQWVDVATWNHYRQHPCPGRGKSMSLLDCGTSQCMACHWAKLMCPDERIKRQAARLGAA